LGHAPAQTAPFQEDQMSIQTLPSPLTFRARTTPRRAPAGAKLYTAVALFVAVLIAEALIIAAAAPSLPDLGALYIATT
jgi:hypothetical protein